MAADVLLSSVVDPMNADAVAANQYPHIQTAGYSGAYADLTCPASPNYPVVTPSRYFVELPVTPYVGNFGSYAMLVKDVTSSTTLTRVSPSVTPPSTNQYMYSPGTSIRPAVIELNSGQAGHTIAFDFYGLGSIVSGGRWNNGKLLNTATLGSNNSTWTVSGLNLLNTFSYKIYISLITTTSDDWVKLYINGDMTTANYYTGYIFITGASVGNGVINTPVYALRPNTSSGGIGMNIVEITFFGTQIFMRNMYSTNSFTTNAVTTTEWRYNQAVSAITSFTMVTNNATTLTTASTMQIYQI